MTELVPFLIRYKVASLRRSTRGTITGSVHVELGPFAFPDRGWSDFIVVIFTWWLEALRKLVSGERRIELLFMDGPYAMHITAVEHTTCLVECIEKVREP